MRTLLHDDRGQMPLVGLAALVLFLTFGVLVVDVGALLNHRRMDQNAADKSALAGAVSLTLNPATQSTDLSDALTAAVRWANGNNVPVAGAYTPTAGPITIPLSDGGTLTLQVINTCYSADDGVWTGVRSTVSRPVAPILIGWLGVTNWGTSATATACAGRSVQYMGMLPWSIGEDSSCFHTDTATGEPVRVPNYGAVCPLSVGGQQSSQGNVGQIGLVSGGLCQSGNPSANQYEADIVGGTQALCSVGDSVAGGPGLNVGPTQQGLQTRLASENDCGFTQSNYATPLEDNATPTPNYLDYGSGSDWTNASYDWAPNGTNPDPNWYFKVPDAINNIDNFFEVWSPDPSSFNPAYPAEHLVANNCNTSGSGAATTSPRNVVIVIVQSVSNPDGTACGQSKCYVVRGFARMYIEGCITTSQSGSQTFSAKCAQQGNGGSLTILGRFVSAVADPRFKLGLAGFGDLSVFLKQ